jgi:hypothetical protein
MPALYDRQPSRPSPEALSILTVSHPPRAALGPAPGHISLRTLSQSAAGTAGRNGGQGPGGLHYRACCQGAHQRGLTTETGGSIPRTWTLINSKPTSGSISFCCSQGTMNGPTLVGIIIPRFAHIVKRSYSPHSLIGAPSLMIYTERELRKIRVNSYGWGTQGTPVASDGLPSKAQNPACGYHSSSVLPRIDLLPNRNLTPAPECAIIGFKPRAPQARKNRICPVRAHS